MIESKYPLRFPPCPLNVATKCSAPVVGHGILGLLDRNDIYNLIKLARTMVR